MLIKNLRLFKILYKFIQFIFVIQNFSKIYLKFPLPIPNFLKIYLKFFLKFHQNFSKITGNFSKIYSKIF